MNKKIVTSSLSLLFLSANISTSQAIELKNNGTDYGNINGQIKAMHIFDDAGNAYDPSSGTSYMVKLKYVSPNLSGFKLGIASYTSGDLLGQTKFGSDITPHKERTAGGLFTTKSGEQVDGTTVTQLGEAFVRYNSKNISFHGGRQILNTPLTKIKSSNIPNFYTVAGVSTQAINKLKLGLTQITEMSYGSRAIADWSLISEATQTAGASKAVHPFAGGSNNIGQGDFANIGKISNFSEDTNGISILSAEFSPSKKTKLAIWNYYSDNISNNLYLEANTKIKIGSKKIILSGQYLKQSEVGDKLAGELDFNLFGAKATFKGKGWMAYAAYNSSNGDSAMYNVYGSDPAYTSSIYSRNAYRKDVSAFKVGLKYKILKNLIIVASHANYGLSDTKVGKIPNRGSCTTSPCSASNDATETDLFLIYKPIKKLVLKLMFVNRESEYNSSHSKELKQLHSRFIMSYKF